MQPSFPAFRRLLSTLVLGGLTSVAAAQEPAAGPAEVELQTAPAQVRPAQAQQGFGTLIDDIELYRMDSPRYVRRQADIVPVDLTGLDLEADVVLTVDGEAVTRNDFRRRAGMYLGIAGLEEDLTRLITEMQVEKLVAAGADRASLEVTDADIDEKLETLIGFAAMQAGSQVQQMGGLEEAKLAAEKKAREDFMRSIETSLGMEAYRKSLAAEVAFERAFLPMPTEPQDYEVWNLEEGPVPEDDPKPDWIPQITWDALGKDETTRNLRYFVKKGGADGTPIPAFFRSQITSAIRHGVVDLMGKHFFFDTELPDDVFMRLGDHDITVDHVWAKVKDDVSDADIALIMRELLTLKAMRKTLEGVGEWMDDATADEEFAKLRKEFEGTLFPLESIILLRGYHSLDRYREHWRHREAYSRWRKKSLTDDEVEDHYRTVGRLFFERGNVVVDLSGRVIDHSEPFEMARFQEIETAMLAAQAEGGFDALMATFEPPASRQAPGDPEAARNFQRNPLRMRLTESELSIFLNGYSLADDIFYHGVPGEVFGPYAQFCRRHAWGAELNAAVWAVRVEGYKRSRPLAPLQGRERDQAIEDYLDLNYFYWSQECLESLLPDVKAGG